MSLPEPAPGLVISYSYLWAAEHGEGAEEGIKNRPCVLVTARQLIGGRVIVTVVPVTHSAPRDPADAIEIPAALKTHLGLDDLPSWIMVTETNDFLWPGPDLRPISVGRFHYGFLPPRFYAYLRNRIVESNRLRRLIPVPRTE